MKKVTGTIFFVTNSTQRQKLISQTGNTHLPDLARSKADAYCVQQDDNGITGDVKRVYDIFQEIGNNGEYIVNGSHALLKLRICFAIECSRYMM